MITGTDLINKFSISTLESTFCTNERTFEELYLIVSIRLTWDHMSRDDLLILKVR